MTQHSRSTHPSTHETRQALRTLLALCSHSTSDNINHTAQRLTEYAQTRLLMLASAQLKAYNSADLNAFCACYAPHVSALRDGEALFEGHALLRERYTPLFEGGAFGAEVTERWLDPVITHDQREVRVSCVDVEAWWRGSAEAYTSGKIWVRYHLSLSLDQLNTLTQDCQHTYSEAELEALEGRLGALIERVEFSSSELTQSV